jgi:hypothetical protein
MIITIIIITDIMGTFGIRVPASQIRVLSTLSVSSALRNGPSARYVVAANDTQIFRHFQQKQCLL